MIAAATAIVKLTLFATGAGIALLALNLFDLQS
jgi:hypothetical protein